MISEESQVQKPAQDTAQQQHHHRRTGGGDDNDRADEAADKGADDAQPAAVADGAGERFAAGGKGGPAATMAAVIADQRGVSD